MRKDQLLRGLGVILLILILLFYQYQKHERFKIYGVYTVAKAIDFEADDQGSTMVYKIIFKNGYFIGKIQSSRNNKVGKYYFLRILPENPSKIGWEEKEVPDCIFARPIPYTGWKELPRCW